MIRNDPVVEQPTRLPATPMKVYPDALELGQFGWLSVTSSEERIPLLRAEQTTWRHKRQVGVTISIGGCIASACCMFGSLAVPSLTSTTVAYNAATWGLIGSSLCTGFIASGYSALHAGWYGRKEVEIEEQINYDPRVDTGVWEAETPTS